MEPVQLLAELVSIPSVNPAFASAGETGTGERALACHLSGIAERAGLEVEHMRVLPDRPNLLIRLSPRGRVRDRLIFAPHLDTVGAPPAHLRPVRRSGRLHGRGACDTKGSVAAMFTALLRTARSGPRPAHTEILFAGLVDEEDGQRGSRAFAAAGYRAGLAIVGEPTRLRVVTAHKGDLWLRLRTRGRAAHGARPELGRNAVLEMARIVQLLETEYAPALRCRRHPLLGHPTLSVGTIAGGRQPNIVPDACEITADRRTLPGETAAGVIREIRALLRLHGLRGSLEDTRNDSCRPLETDPTLPRVRELMAAAGQRVTVGVDYFCDAAVLSAGGVPSVVFGPGDIAQAHTTDEWVSEREVERAAAVLETFLRRLP